MLCEFTALRLPVMERVGKPRTCPCVRAAYVLVLLTQVKKILDTGGACVPHVYTHVVAPHAKKKILGIGVRVFGSHDEVYAVWRDARFNGFQRDQVAFSRSEDGGHTWSTPLRISTHNQTRRSLRRSASSRLRRKR